jgi:hypothetical protein
LKKLKSDKEIQGNSSLLLGFAWDGLCRTWLHLGKFRFGLVNAGDMTKLVKHV